MTWVKVPRTSIASINSNMSFSGLLQTIIQSIAPEPDQRKSYRCIRMKFLLFYFTFLLALLTSLVTCSESNENSEPDKFDSYSSSYFTNAESVKQVFIFALMHGDVELAKSFVEKYNYLTSQFNVDIFIGLLQCFNGQEAHETCMELFELIKPSFLDVSESSSSPLIHAIIYNNMDVVNALLKMPEAKNFIDKIDRFGRTALMYAAKRGSYYAVLHILQTSEASVNVIDAMGKTALHYACEMNSLKESNTISFQLPNWITGETDVDATNKLNIFMPIFYAKCNILSNGPEYKLNSSDDKEISEIIKEHKGKVHVECDSTEIILSIIKSFALKTLIAADLQQDVIGFLFTNPLMMALNNFCYHLQQLIFPGVDMNFVISFDLGDSFQDFSFNILFVLLIAILLSKAAGIDNISKALNS